MPEDHFCPPDPKDSIYCISETEWINYQKEMFHYFSEQYKNSNPKIFVLFNPSGDLALQRWMLDSLPRFWIKLGPIADRYQLNREAERWDTRWIEDFKPLPSRGEMDLTDMGWFAEDSVGNMYWSQLWALHNGLDMHNQLVKDVQESRFHFAFEFFTNYAGYTSPEQSHGAWIALRDGLDAADTIRFPENIYGELRDGENKQRYVNIAKAFSAYGAIQSDTTAGKKTSWDALNDVGYKIHPGNYEMWIHQIEPQTSQGYWRQGPKEQVFGRFARGFGQINKMYFDIDDRFFLNNPLAGAYPIKIRVVYLDIGNGKWAIDYDALSGQKNIEVQKQNSGSWQQFITEITDAHFGNRLEKGADLILRNVDSEQDIFHMIEVTRESGSTSIEDIGDDYITFTLYQNYPNPFNPTTTIEFDLPKDEIVTLKVYALDGREVKTLIEKKLYRAGRHRISWDGTSNAGNKVGSGVYVYRIEAGKFKASKKMIFLK